MIIKFGENDPRGFDVAMKVWRDALLNRSDWAMAADAPTNKTKWAEYRQALRDFPATWTPGPEANFPEEPTE